MALCRESPMDDIRVRRAAAYAATRGADLVIKALSVEFARQDVRAILMPGWTKPNDGQGHRNDKFAKNVSEHFHARWGTGADFGGKRCT